MRKSLPTKEHLDRLFIYEPETGNLIRRITTSSNAKEGDVIKNFCKKGYRRARLGENSCYAHRIIWKMYYNQEPPDFIDHKNKDKSDNRIENLIESNPSHNGFNRNVQKNNKSGFTGIKIKSCKFVVTINKNKRTLFIGTFDTLEEAINEREKHAVALFVPGSGGLRPDSLR